MWYTINSSEEWLSRLAIEYLGSASKWTEIYNMNKDIIGPNPDIIQPGMTIWIPVNGKQRPVSGPNSLPDASVATLPYQNAPGKIPVKAPMSMNKIMIGGGAALAALAFFMLKK